MNIHSSLIEVKGVGDKTEKLFQKMGVYTVGDILFHFPRTYLQFPDVTNVFEVTNQETCAICGTLKTPAINKKTRNLVITTATMFTQDGNVIELVWFRSPYIKASLKVGENYVFYGKISMEHNRYKMEHPSVYTLMQYHNMQKSLFPIYTTTAHLSNTTIKKTQEAVLSQVKLEDKDIPKEILIKHQLADFSWAMHQIHFPTDFDALTKARERLVYDEFFYFLLQQKFQQEKQELENNHWNIKDLSVVNKVKQKLPFELTNGQESALSDILNDLSGAFISQRLIQGDVGSGKTIVAFLAMLAAISNGYQAAIMAPTEVLARQHYQSFTEMIGEYQLPYECVCLTGSMTAKEKRECYQRIANEKQLFIIGTHALIQEKVIYHDLALVITDEQHRFGVKQREIFSQKGQHPHVLVMSATPIPRTLAMIIYGNMQVSVISDVPAKRLPIKNCVVDEHYRKTAYEFMRKQIKEGRQVYVICPLVEASEKTEAENVVEYAKRLKEYYQEDVRIGLLHGKMKAVEKNQIMEDFFEHKSDILVSTTVVEVGMNVPNATVMVIENANRFGLAQLHQLRGRVGRGQWQSYCIMFNASKSKESAKRLDILNQSNDGFYIASEDLKMRGPGDFFGIRQSGELDFKLADVIGDAKILEEASSDVEHLLEEDPALSQEEHRGLYELLKYYMEKSFYCL